MRASLSTDAKKSVAVIGTGGNIGSHVVTHLARMEEVGRLLLIDRDVYEQANLRSQSIRARDVGKSKAHVQARILRSINPRLRVTAIKAAVERVPLGLLRTDVILACLDSRRARQYVNQSAWRLGVMWIDSGVDGEQLLARVNVYAPGFDNPCLECAWDERDYAQLEQTYPCSGSVEQGFSTNAPSSLGALAASLQAIECQKILRGEIVATGQQVLIDAAHYKHYITSFKRNPDCLFAGHDIWDIRKLKVRPEVLTLAQALKLAGDTSISDGVSLRVEGNAFVKRLTCARCGRIKELLRLRSSLKESEIKCSRCGVKMISTGIDLTERLNSALLSPNVFSLPLRAFGFRRGDVFSVVNKDEEVHYEISPDRARS